MHILLNDTLTLSAQAQEGNFYITGVSGLGIADIRTSSFLFSGRDGGLVTGQYLGFRNIDITGKIGSPDRAQHQLDRVEMANALPIGVTFPVYITLFDESTYRIDCRLAKLNMEFNRGGRTSDFLIQLIAGDPLFYSTDGGELHSATVSRVTPGGYVTPYILPVSWESGSSPTIVTNAGSIAAYPVITLNDAAINPVITNQTTGESFALDITTVSGDELIIDMANRTVSLNGANVIGNKTADSVWWALQVGDNSIVLNSDSGSDDVTADIVWRNGILGI
jgi:hypothetical protein